MVGRPWRSMPRKTWSFATTTFATALVPSYKLHVARWRNYAKQFHVDDLAAPGATKVVDSALFITETFSMAVMKIFP